MKRLLLLVAAWVALLYSVEAQVCSINTNVNGFGGTANAGSGVGQSFTACGSGKLNHVRVTATNTSTATAYAVIYSGEGFVGEIARSGTIQVGLNRTNQFDFSSLNINLVSGQKYTARFFAASGSPFFQYGTYGGADYYSGGRILSYGASNNDMFFSSQIATLNAPTLVPLTTGTDISKSDTFQLQFDRPMTAGSGSIEVREVSGNALVASIAAEDLIFEENNVSFFIDNVLDDLTEYTIVVPSGAVWSESGIKYTGITSGNWTFTTREGVYATLSFDDKSATNQSPFAIDINFDRYVTGLTAGLFEVTNGTADNLQGADSLYTLDITPTAEGEVTIVLPIDVVATSGGVSNERSNPLAIDYEIQVPEATLSADFNYTSANGLFEVTVDFSEQVDTLSADDFNLVNASVLTIESQEDTTFTVTLEAAEAGEVSVALLADAVEDLAGNLAGASDPVSFYYMPDVRTNQRVHYAFDGNLTDASGNSGSLDVTVGSAAYDTDRLGRVDSAFVFGNSDLRRTGFTSNSSTGFSVSTWINPTTTLTDGSPTRVIMEYYGRMVLRYQGSVIRFDVANLAGTNHVYQVDTTLDQGTWYHLAVSVDAGGLLRIFLDGEEIHRDDAPADIKTGAEILYVGKGAFSGTYAYRFPAAMDDFMIYSKALSAGEVSSLYNNAQYAFSESDVTICEGDSYDAGGITFDSAGVYSYIVDGGAELDTLVTLNLTATSLPNVNLTGSAVDICEGTEIVLSATGAETYSTGGTFQLGESIVPTSTTSYSVTGTDANGCTNTSELTVEVSATSIVDEALTVDQNVFCVSGDTASITTEASVTGVNYTLKNVETDTLIDGPLAGTGSSLAFSTGSLSESASYYVHAEEDNNSPTSGLDFDGVNDKVVIPHRSEMTLTGQFTIEGWINSRATTYKRIFTNYSGTGSTQGDIVIDMVQQGASTQNGRGLRLYMNPTSLQPHIVSAGNVFNLNEWHHFAVRFDSGAVDLMVDGVIVQSGQFPESTLPLNTTSWVLGEDRGGVNGEYFNGKMDEFRVWNYARTDSEIRINRKRSLSGNETGLVTYFKFDDGTGSSSLANSSPLGNDGALTAMDPATDWVEGVVPGENACQLILSDTISIAVGDDIAPEIMVEDITLTLDNEGSATLAFEDIDTGTNDNCSAAEDLVFSLSQSEFGIDHVGENTIYAYAEDAQGNIDSAEVTVTIESVPTDIGLNNSEIAAGLPVGSRIGFLSSTNPDEAATHTYSLSGADATSFTINSDELVSAEVFDANVKSSYEVTITSSDGGGSVDKDFTITVTDLDYSSGRLAFYDFTNGDLTNEGHQDYNAVAVGSPDTVANRFGDSKRALGISDGNYARVNTFIFPSGSAEQINSAAVNVWFKIDEDVTYSPKIIDSRVTPSQAEAGGITLTLTPERKLKLLTFKTIGGFGNTLELAPEEVVSLNEWHMVTFTKTGYANMSLYLDGKMIASGTASTSDGTQAVEAGNNWTFGAQGNSNAELPGAIDDISFYTQFSQTLFNALYNSEEPSAVPTDITLSSDSIDENVSIGSTVATLTTTDADADDTHTYSLSGTDAASFAIDGSNLNTAVEIDFETKSSYSITISTNDGNGGVYEEDFIIGVADVNEDPTDIELSANSVDENLDAGTVVGTLSGTDLDADQTLTFSTTSAAFEIDGNELVTAISFDYETTSSYEVVITAEDGEGGSYDETFTITVNDLSAPQVVYDGGDLTLNTGFGTYEILVSDMFVDDEGDAMLHSATSSSFGIVSAQMMTDPARLVLSEGTSGKVTITVTADDQTGNPIATLSFDVIVADIESSLIAHYKYADGVDHSGLENDGINNSVGYSEDRFGNAGGAMEFNGANSYLKLPNSLLTKDEITLSLWFKTTSNGALVGYQNTAVGTYPNNWAPIAYVATTNDLKASFWQGTTNNISNASANDGEWHHMVLTGTSGQQQLYVDNVLVGTDGDYINQTNQVFNQLGTGFTGGTWQGGNGSYFYFGGSMDDVRVYERVLSEQQIGALYNESAPELPELDAEIADQSIDEDAEPFTLIADLNEYFSNSNDEALNFEIADSFDSALVFSVDGSALLVDSIAADYNGSGTVTVKARNSNGFVADQFTLTVKEVNDAPVFELSTEEVIAGMNFEDEISVLVIPESVPEDEKGQTVTYSISPAISFANIEINEFTGAIAIQSIANESGSETITVTADDGQGENGVYTQTFTLTVNENQAPVEVTPIVDFTVNEDSLLDVIDISGVFSDSDGDALTLTASSSDEEVMVSVTDTDLQITLGEDYFGTAVITLTATDTESGTATSDFTLVVNGVNDAPEVDMTFETLIANEGEAFAYTLPEGAFVDVDGDALTYSVDVLDASQWLGYTISVSDVTLSGTPTSAFSGSSYDVEITATDGVESAIVTLTIMVQGINDAPTDIVLSATSVDENSAQGTVVASISTTDPDTNDSFTYEISGTNSESIGEDIGETESIPFAISGSEIVTTSVLDHEAVASYDVVVTTTDAAGATFSKNFSISVNDVAEAPTSLGLSNASIVENNETNAVIGTFSVEDPDNGESYQYSLSGAVSEEGNPFDIQNDQLLANTTFNFEVQSSYSVDVTVNDGRGNSFTETFTISIVDGNDAPANLTLSGTIVPAGAEVGALIGTLNADDEDGDAVLSYTVDNSLFTIDGADLKLASVIDVATLEKNPIAIDITVQDDQGASVTETFEITVEGSATVLNEVKEVNLIVYPNPASEFIHVESGSESVLDLVSVDGQKIISGYTNRKLDITSLKAGVYLIRIKQTGQILRFIKKN